MNKVYLGVVNTLQIIYFLFDRNNRFLQIWIIQILLWKSMHCQNFKVICSLIVLCHFSGGNIINEV